jgi:hypothetical protein
MPLTIPSGFANVSHKMLLAGDPEPMIVTYGLEVAGAQTGGASITNATEMHDAFHLEFKNVVAAEYTLVETALRYGAGAGGSELLEVASFPLAMLGGSPGLPQNCAALFHKRTAVAGRRGRGRFYLPGLYEAGVDGKGRIDPTQLNAMNTAGSNFLAKIVTLPNVGPMVVLHGPSTALNPTPEPAPTPVVSLTCDPVIATQRTRLRR